MSFYPAHARSGRTRAGASSGKRFRQVVERGSTQFAYDSPAAVLAPGRDPITFNDLTANVQPLLGRNEPFPGRNEPCQLSQGV
jgi:hypothetical protein